MPNQPPLLTGVFLFRRALLVTASCEARSISSPYLLSLGASTDLIGTVTGAGEFLGYAVRLISGRAGDEVWHP
ncbi:MAG: hypothetical protein V1862_02165 [Methanobacteriota archaeon]